MIYDAFGRMAEQTRGSSHTQIAYSPNGQKMALMNGQTLVKAYVTLPSGAKAVYTGSGLAYYRHADHLGSSVVVQLHHYRKFAASGQLQLEPSTMTSPTLPTVKIILGLAP